MMMKEPLYEFNVGGGFRKFFHNTRIFSVRGSFEIQDWEGVSRDHEISLG